MSTSKDATVQIDGAGHAPAPHYELFEGEGAFQAAVDRLLGETGRELRIFDPDLAALKLNSPARVARLERFLRGSRARRLHIVVHDPDLLTKRCPRMMRLVTLYAHVIQVHRTPEDLRNLQDAFLVLDAAHYVRRPVASVFRGALGLDDRSEALAMRSRFLELWAVSEPAVSPTTLGL